MTNKYRQGMEAALQLLTRKNPYRAHSKSLMHSRLEWFDGYDKAARLLQEAQQRIRDKMIPPSEPTEN